jgi:hypothetical protein
MAQKQLFDETESSVFPDPETHEKLPHQFCHQKVEICQSAFMTSSNKVADFAATLGVLLAILLINAWALIRP